MLILRFVAIVLAVVVLAIVAAVTDAVWLAGIAVVVLIVLTVVSVLLALHYLGAPDWLGGSGEAQLEQARLVEPESGLPTRRRWNERQARQYAEEVARRGLVAVPEGWRGPDGAHPVLLVTTAAVPVEVLREQVSGVAPAQELAVLVVAPTLAANGEVFHRGDAVEAVEHAEAVGRRQVELLREAGIDASGHIGPADPAVAVSDGLRTYRAERVVVARRRNGGRYLEDVPVDRAAGVFGVPITEIDLASVAPAPSSDPSPG